MVNIVCVSKLHLRLETRTLTKVPSLFAAPNRVEIYTYIINKATIFQECDAFVIFHCLFIFHIFSVMNFILYLLVCKKIL